MAKNHTSGVSLKMPDSLYKKMERMAKRRKATKSRLLRDLLEEEYRRILDARKAKND